MSFSNYLDAQSVPYEYNVSLAQKSWIRQGGHCGIWVMPQNKKQLQEICVYLYAKQIGFIVVGQTSNIFFHSTYNPEILISTIHVRDYMIEGDIITCDCGLSVVKLAKECLEKGYAGFYGLVGLPGTVASAAVNNAGCFKCSISSMLISADVLLPNGTIQTFLKEDFQYSHRSSVFKRGERKGIILSVKLKVEKANDIEEEYRKAEETKVYRKNKQEGPNRNLGSVFSSLTRKRNMKNRLAIHVARVASKLHLSSQKRTYKQMLLWLYGYSDLSRYISDKQINTFVWRDAEAEKKFVRYKEFMGKVFDDLIIEIEERQ